MPTPDQAAQAEEVRSAQEAEGGNADSSSLQKTDTKSFDDRLAAADTPEAIEKLTRELAETPAKAKSDESQEQSEAKEDDAGSEEGQKNGKSEEEADAGEAAKEETEEEADDKEEGKETDGADSKKSEQDEEEEGEADWSKKSKQFRGRIAEDDKAGALATVILRGNSGRVKAGLAPLTLKQAMAQAERELGMDKAETKEGDKNAEGGEKSTLPATPEAVDAKIKELRAERARVWRDEVDMDKVNELDQQIDDLREHKQVIKEQAVTTEKTEQAEYDRQFEDSKKSAADAYDFVGEAEGDAATRMKEIDDEMERSKDPTFHDPNKPLIIAQMVAKELRIAPRKKGEAKQEEKKQASTAKVVAKPLVKSVVASGANRTVTKTTQQSQQLAAIDGIKSLADLEKYGVGGA